MRPRRKELDPSTIGFGWAYAVRKAMWPALDIRGECRVYKSKPSRWVWTQGNPPTYAFKRGDTVHARDGWHTVQVMAINRDCALTIALFKRNPKACRSRPEEPLYREIDRWACYQADFVAYLRTVTLPSSDTRMDDEWSHAA